jgi:hypothetical protein
VRHKFKGLDRFCSFCVPAVSRLRSRAGAGICRAESWIAERSGSGAPERLARTWTETLPPAGAQRSRTGVDRRKADRIRNRARSPR